MKMIALDNRQSDFMDTNLTTAVRLGPHELPNRIVMAPLTRNRAGAGNVPQAESSAVSAGQRTGA